MADLLFVILYGKISQKTDHILVIMLVLIGFRLILAKPMSVNLIFRRMIVKFL